MQKIGHLGLKFLDPRKWDQIGGVEREELGVVIPLGIDSTWVVSVGSDLALVAAWS